MCLFEPDCRASHTWGPSVPYGVGYPQMPWEPSVANRARAEAPQRAGWCWALTAASMMGTPGTCCLSEMLWAQPRWALPPGHQVQCPATERAAALMPKGLWALGGKAGGTGCQGTWYRIGRGEGCKGARLGDPGGWGQLPVAGPGLCLRLKLILLSSTALQRREWTHCHVPMVSLHHRLTPQCAVRLASASSGSTSEMPKLGPASALLYFNRCIRSSVECSIRGSTLDFLWPWNAHCKGNAHRESLSSRPASYLQVPGIPCRRLRSA